MNKPSHRQQAVYDTWKNEDCNILIGAVAGSGKTTTLLELLKMCESRTLFLAFNKSIQEEIQRTIEERGLVQGKALTMHSLGYLALKSHFKKIIVYNSKKFELIKLVQENMSTIFKKMKWEKKLALTYTIMDLNDLSRLFLTNDLDTLKTHLASMDKPFNSHPKIKEIWKNFLDFREKSYTLAEVKIDFIDMIYLPIHLNLTIPIYPSYLMMDEVQDFNLCQHKLIDKLISQGTIKKWIAVGDRNQAIYGFSGAYSSSFEMFHQKEGVVKELPLDINYRSKSNIVAQANLVFDVMESFHEDEGIVETITEPAFIKSNSMVICRNIKPLIEVYFELLSLGKSAYIKGEDLLSGVIRYLKPYSKDMVRVARIKFLEEIEVLESKKSEDAKIKLYKAQENFAIYRTVVKYMATDNTILSDLIEKLKTLCVVKKDAVALCSIHKSKGLEEDVVYILNENLIPSKFAESPEQLKQEENLKYVARTRARKELYYLNI